jgi:hypothetical protein
VAGWVFPGTTDGTALAIMIIYAVPAAEAFSRTHFSSPEYVQNAVVVLNALLQNLRFVLDRDGCGFKQLFENVASAGSVGGANRVVAAFEEVLKQQRVSRSRILQVAEVPPGEWSKASRALAAIATAAGADCVLVSAASSPLCGTGEIERAKLAYLGEYVVGPVEAKRLQAANEFSCEEASRAAFEDSVVRLTRHSNWLTLYDPYIGINAHAGCHACRSSSAAALGRAVRGIVYIDSLWQRACAAGVRRLTINTTVQRGCSLPSADAARQACASLEAELRSKLVPEVNVDILLREGAPLTHARYLESAVGAARFDCGFDCVDGNGTLRFNRIQYVEVHAHLRRVDALPSLFHGKFFVPGRSRGGARKR